MDDSPRAFLEINCKTPGDLLNQIDSMIARDPGAHANGYAWAYRGQADASWHLVPSALRPGTVLGYYPNRASIESTGNGKCVGQMNGEIIVVRQFAELADRVGLPVPGLSKVCRQDGFDLGHCNTAGLAGGIGLTEWPKPEMLELIALAQHHGVPTRLLDFTFSPRIALFFAAHDFVKQRPKYEDLGVSHMALWFVNVNFLYRYAVQFEIVEVPRAMNSFLHAQKGVFILDRRSYHETINGQTPPLDQRIIVTAPVSITHPILVKATLPVTEAEETLRFLSRQGIDRPHLMPSYGEVVSYLSGLHPTKNASSESAPNQSE